MSEENSALSVTLKAGAGFEAPWLNVRADDPETLKRRLNAVLDADLASLVAQAAVGLQAVYTARDILGAQPVAAAAPAQVVPAEPVAQVVQFPTPADVFAPQQPAPAPAPAPVPQPAVSNTQIVDKWGNVYTYNAPGAPTCPHGARILKQGRKKDGTPYSSYICPQVDQFFRVQTDCKPIYQK